MGRTMRELSPGSIDDGISGNDGCAKLGINRGKGPRYGDRSYLDSTDESIRMQVFVEICAAERANIPGCRGLP